MKVAAGGGRALHDRGVLVGVPEVSVGEGVAAVVAVVRRHQFGAPAHGCVTPLPLLSTIPGTADERIRQQFITVAYTTAEPSLWEEGLNISCTSSDLTLHTYYFYDKNVIIRFIFINLIATCNELLDQDSLFCGYDIVNDTYIPNMHF